VLYYHLIAQVVEALGDVFVHGYYVDKVITHRFKDHPKWGARDRKQFAETVYEIVRWWRWNWYLAGLPDSDYLDKDKITRERTWLVWGAYWTVKTGSVPPFGECETLTADAVQKRAQTIVSPAIRSCVPDWMNEMGKQQLGQDWPDLLRALNRPADVFLRANTVKIQAKPLALNLIKEEIETTTVPDLPDGLQLVKRQNVFGSKAFRAGLFEVQDGGSQMISPFLQVQPGMRVIDACAGAGGKTLHLACLMKNKGLIHAMDIHEWKLTEMRKRFRRNEITIIEPSLITGDHIINKQTKKADRLLLDVPCSGIGVLRRNPDAKWKLQPAEIERLNKLQAELLRSYSRMVKIGGKMVYATCSVLPSENENQIASFLAERGDEWELEDEQWWKPNQNGFDGFYAARLRRKDPSEPVAEAGEQKSEVRSQRSEIGSRKSEIRDQKSQVKKPKVSVEQRVELKPSKVEQKPQTRTQKAESSAPKPTKPGAGGNRWDSVQTDESQMTGEW
jgi:16S rRNA (cytosine967-C5)-methyltransferase